MLSESIRQAVSCDELQLGQALNHCVENGQKAKFALLLSFLSPDVRDQPQFDFRPDSPAKKEINWRRFFDLPQPQPLYANNDDLSATISRWSERVHQGQLRDVQLEQLLATSPLCPAYQHLDAAILNNMSLLERLKFEEQQGNIATAELPDEIKPAAMVGVMNDFDYQQPLKVHAGAPL